MDLETHLERWSALHGGVEPRGVVRGWLTVVHALASPLVRLRMSPDAITLLGLGLSVAAPVAAAVGGRAGVAVAGVLVLLAGLLDGLDGAVAVMSDRVSVRGARLDMWADRLGEAAFGAALWAAGASGWVCAAAVALAWAHEGVRARMRVRGVQPENGGAPILTISERPTRVLVTGMFLLAAAARPDEPWAAWGAWALVVVGAVGFVQLLVAGRRESATGAGRQG